jgi:sulfhydrogenase subunit beta (sulfur reductase)
MKRCRLRKEELKTLFTALEETHRVMGPKVEARTVVLSEIAFDDLPAGVMDEQGPGRYRLMDEKSDSVFSFSPGPDSFKKFLHPPAQEVWKFEYSPKEFIAENLSREEKPLAFFGARACDIAALSLLDKVFLEGPVPDAGFSMRRKDILVIAVHCMAPHGNCFCESMGTGPELLKGFDIAMTELDKHFLIEAGSSAGEKILERVACEDVQEKDLRDRDARILACKKMMTKAMNTGDLPDLIYRNMEHPRWAEIARKDLECGNCTMVCPTCFCNSTFDHLSFSSLSKKREERSGVRKRTWDSCFSKNFARVHGGNFRHSRRARYRHWMSHKLAYWFEQFGASGCVGCGRCITWCPVGIDITEELEALRSVR